MSIDVLKMTQLKILLPFLFIHAACLAQSDTLFYKKVDTKVVNTLASLDMEVIDTLKIPKAYLLKNAIEDYIIAFRNKDHIEYFNVLPPEKGVVDSIQWRELNGKPFKELVVYWSDVYGHSGLGGGLRVSHKGVLIYDLRNKQLMFDQEYFDSHYNWSNDISEDLEVLDTSETLECSNYEIQFKEQQMTMGLKPSEECPDIDVTDYETHIWVYKFMSHYTLAIPMKR